MAKYKYKKNYRIRNSKPIFKKRFFWQFSLAIFCFLGIGYFFLFSQIFQIQEINITGAQKVSKDEMMAQITRILPRNMLFFKTDNIFLANISQSKEFVLQTFPQVKEVVFDRDFPSKLKIEIKEKEGRAVWCSNECYLMDEDGVIFEKSSASSSLIQIQIQEVPEQIDLGQVIIQKSLLSSVLKLKTFVKEKTGLEIEKAALVSNERANLKTQEGWEIYFNLKEDLQWQATKLTLVLEKEITPEKRSVLEYIDLRFTRVYYK